MITILNTINSSFSYSSIHFIKCPSAAICVCLYTWYFFICFYSANKFRYENIDKSWICV